MTFTDKQYEMHYNRIREMLVISGEYVDESEWMLDTDTRLILSEPEQNPEYFTL
jgi:hypothetical protein